MNKSDRLNLAPFDASDYLDSEEVIARRMRDAKNEMSHYAEYDYLVVNDDFSSALKELDAIICSLRLRQSIQADRLQSQLSALLA